MTFPFTFKIYGYNEGDNKYFEQNGVGICNGYADAARILEERYADELIAIKHIEIFEEATIIPMSKEMINEIVNEYFYGTNTFETEVSDEEVNKL